MEFRRIGIAKTNFRKNLSAISIELRSMTDAFCRCKMHIVNDMPRHRIYNTMKNGAKRMASSGNDFFLRMRTEGLLMPREKRITRLLGAYGRMSVRIDDDENRQIGEMAGKGAIKETKARLFEVEARAGAICKMLSRLYGKMNDSDSQLAYSSKSAIHFARAGRNADAARMYREFLKLLSAQDYSTTKNGITVDYSEYASSTANRSAELFSQENMHKSAGEMHEKAVEIMEKAPTPPYLLIEEQAKLAGLEYGKAGKKDKSVEMHAKAEDISRNLEVRLEKAYVYLALGEKGFPKAAEMITAIYMENSGNEKVGKHFRVVMDYVASDWENRPLEAGYIGAMVLLMRN